MKVMLSAILVLVGTTCIWAQQPAQNEDEETARLAKAVQKPVASLTTLPFQDNLNYAIGDFNRYQNVMNTMYGRLLDRSRAQPSMRS
jgi:hypothetical protein